MQTSSFLGFEIDFNHLIVSILLLFCGVALATIVLHRIRHAGQKGTISHLIYGLCLFACGLCCYLYTTRSSALPVPLLRQLDHSAIFLLIAGTCTPFASRSRIEIFGLQLVYWIWGVALTGIALRFFLDGNHDNVFVFIYAGMGWLFFAAVRDIAKRTSLFSLSFLATGAIIYSIGAIIFSVGVGGWTDTIWHCFVLCAAIMHFIAVLSLASERRSDFGRPMLTIKRTALKLG